MKKIFTIFLLCLQSSLFSQDLVEYRLKGLEEFKVENWLTLSIGVNARYSDYIIETDIIIQKLPDSRFLLSVRSPGENLYVARRYISKIEVDEIKERAIRFLETAIPELSLKQKVKDEKKRLDDPKTITKYFPQGCRSMAIILKITLPESEGALTKLFSKSNEFSTNDWKRRGLHTSFGLTKIIGANFSEEMPTINDYLKFFEELRK